MLKKSLLLLLVAGMLLSCNTNMGQKTLDTEIKKVSYSLGVNAGSYYLTQGFDSIDIGAFTEGFQNAIQDKDLQITEAEANTILQEFFERAASQKFEHVKTEGKEFLEENGKKEGVVTLASGLQYEVIKEGAGATPQLTDKVTTHYHGTLIDGTVFDSSVDRGEPIAFPVNGVIPGWTEALQLMKVGSKWRLFVPYDLAYGERGSGQKIGPFTTLIFEVELLGIEN